MVLVVRSQHASKARDLGLIENGPRTAVIQGERTFVTTFKGPRDEIIAGKQLLDSAQVPCEVIH